MTTVSAWHTRLETTTSAMMDGLHIKDIKVTPKEIHSKWHLCITKGEWLHIIDFICSSSEIWHAADSSAEIVKFYTTQNVLWRRTDCEDQIFARQPRCVLNSHCTYFTGFLCISRNGLESMNKNFFLVPLARVRTQSHVLTRESCEKSCNDDLTPSDMCMLQHRCFFNHLVGWAGTCKLWMPSQVVRDCQRNVWQKIYFSPAGWISTVEKYTWGHYCTRTVDFDFFFVFVVSQVGLN